MRFEDAIMKIIRGVLPSGDLFMVIRLAMLRRRGSLLGIGPHRDAVEN
jgi:hypothetical protein